MGKSKQKSQIVYRPVNPWEKAKHEKEAGAGGAASKFKKGGKGKAKGGKKVAAAADAEPAGSMAVDDAPEFKAAGGADDESNWVDSDDEDGGKAGGKPSSALRVKKKITKRKIKERGKIVSDKLEARAAKHMHRKLQKIQRKHLWD
ncbi:hypothetical protein H9P43_001912 [Blastocladiella emersonii ATCC 22665]|nr:hypothetical protein H9P43_001912 [Blastocladiella emersonii ATCC 22665]